MKKVGDGICFYVCKNDETKTKTLDDYFPIKYIVLLLGIGMMFEIIGMKVLKNNIG